MCKQFAVSRTVIREAISRLQAAAVVETRHGIGTFVLPGAGQSAFRLGKADLETLQDVIWVLELRIAVETETAALAAERRRPIDLTLMRRALKGFESAVKQGTDAIEHDVAFHHSIAQSTRNPHFMNLLGAMGEGAIPRSRLKSIPQGGISEADYLRSVNEEHAEILAAIADANPDAARSAMRRHLEKSRDRKMQSALAVERQVVENRRRS